MGRNANLGDMERRLGVTKPTMTGIEEESENGTCTTEKIATHSYLANSRRLIKRRLGFEW